MWLHYKRKNRIKKSKLPSKQMVNLLEHKRMQTAITLLTVAFFALSIWNIHQGHKYRKLQYELDLKKSGIA